MEEEELMELIECPVCGKKIPYDIVEYLDNGNPACPNCVMEEQKELEKTE